MDRQNLTIDELLRSKTVRYNDSKLAKILNVNRQTIAKYRDDLTGDRHLVRYKNDKYELLTIASRRS